MPTVLLPTGDAPANAAQFRIRESVQLALFNATPERSPKERRRITRHPFPYPVYLTPVGEDGKPILDSTVAVLGRHLSLLGLDFYHREPLPFRRVIVSLPCGPETYIGLLMDLTWCRFNRHGWYDSGGPFVQAVDSPLKSGWKY